MKSWSTDVRNLVPAQQPAPAPEAARRALFAREIVEAATSRGVVAPWCSAVRCIARLGRRGCGGRVHVGIAGAGRIEWECRRCGEQGVLTGFEGTDLDMSAHVPARKKLRLWGFDDEERAVLFAATALIPSLRAVISRASPHIEIEGLLILQATVDELDRIYTLVEELTVMTRSRRRIELLDGLRRSLCTAIDGF